MTSKAQCTVFDAALEDYSFPKFASNFENGVATLANDINAYYRFIDAFGTHYMKQMKMGSRFSVFYKLTDDGYSRLLKEGISVEASASYSAEGITGSLSTKTDKEKEMASKFDAARESYTEYSIGSTLPSDRKADTWAQQTFTQPVPLTYTLDTIDKVLAVKLGADSPVVAKMREAL